MRKSQLIFDKTVGKTVFYGFNLFAKAFRESEFFGKQVDLQGYSFERILVLRPGGIGDALAALPFFGKLTDTFQQAQIDVVCSRRNADIFTALPYFGNRFVIDKYRRALSLLKDLMGNHYQIVFDLDQGKYITSVLSYLTGAAIRVGFDVKRRRSLYTHIINYQQSRYEPENFLRQLLPFRVPVEFSQEELSFPIQGEYLDKARLLLRNEGIDEKDYLIMVNIGGLNKQNRLRSEEYTRLMPMILALDESIKIIFTGDKRDALRVKEILHRVKSDRISDLSGKTSLMESMALMKFSPLFVGHDGGPLHMAVSMGSKTVSIWGPSLFDKWAPRGEGHRFVRKSLFCQPCVYGRFPEFPGCPYGLRCMKMISAGDIVEEVERIIRNDLG